MVELIWIIAIGGGIALAFWIFAAAVPKRAVRRRKREETKPAAGDAPSREPDPADVTGLRFDILLTYVDRQGERTDRRVTVRDAWGEFGKRGGFTLENLIRGHCHLRDGLRTFHVMGMESVADAETGEVVTGLRSIERWLSVRIGGEVRAGRGKRRHG